MNMKEVHARAAVRDSVGCTPSHGGCCSVQGGRSYNEDRHVVQERFHRITGANHQEVWCQLFGVFDGHGGSKVSEFCAAGIPDFLRSELSNLSKANLAHLLGEQPQSLTNTEIQNVAVCLANAFVSADKALSEDIVLSGEAQLMGTTAVTALLCKEHLWVANCGDSRAVVCRDGVAKPLTEDHKASCPREAARIAKAGGAIISNGGPRLMGILTVTRAIGDHALHPHGLIPTPDVTYYRRSGMDQFLILASDGLWDVMTDQDATDLVSRVFARAQGHSSGVKRSSIPNIAASVLTRVAIARGSQDNVTATVVDLRVPSALPPRQRLHSLSHPVAAATECTALTAGHGAIKACSLASSLSAANAHTGTQAAAKVCSVASSARLPSNTSLISAQVSWAADEASQMISDELRALPSGSSSQSDSDAKTKSDDAGKVTKPDGGSPFAEQLARRKRSVNDNAEEHMRAQKVQRALSLSRGLSSAGCSGEVQFDVQRSGFLTVPQSTCC